MMHRKNSLQIERTKRDRVRNDYYPSDLKMKILLTLKNNGKSSHLFGTISSYSTIYRKDLYIFFFINKSKIEIQTKDRQNLGITKCCIDTT